MNTKFHNAVCTLKYTNLYPVLFYKSRLGGFEFSIGSQQRSDSCSIHWSKPKDFLNTVDQKNLEGSEQWTRP